MMIENRKFIFALVSLIIGTLFSWVMRYEGTVYLQIFSVVTVAYLTSQAVVDWKGTTK